MFSSGFAKETSELFLSSSLLFVIPAKAGIQLFSKLLERLDPGLRRDDEKKG